SCPQLSETIKWGMPAFEYKGPLAGMAAFKQHCVFGFWKHELLLKDSARAKQAMGSFGRITSLDDLPTQAAFRTLARRAVRLNDQGVRAPRTKTRSGQSASMHPELRRALRAAPAARRFLESLPPDQQREYLDWIAEAKRDETRAQRIATAVEWLGQGKRRNWKYEAKARGSTRTS
ncbi:MAG: YdeI/OmpD-associated family protein, partial [Planctomycetia bacterium]